MAKKVYAVPVKREVYGEVLVWAESESEAKMLAIDNEGHYSTSDSVIQDSDNEWRDWQVCSGEVHETDYYEPDECFNYEDDDEQDDDEQDDDESFDEEE